MAWEPDYCTMDEFKDFLKIKDTKDDALIARAITASSRAVDRYCSRRPNGLGARRQFGKVAASEARFYTPRWDTEQGRWVIEIDDLASATGLVVAIDQDNDDIYEQTITDYVLRPRDALANGRPYTQISIGINSSVQPLHWPDSARVTSDQFGWSAFPVPVVEGTLLQTNRIHKKRLAPFKDTGSSSSGTNQTVNSIVELDDDIKSTLETYIKLVMTP